MPPFEKNRLVVGSRKCGLAMWQTEHVIGRLQRAWPDVVLEIRTYVTEGDDDLETALPEIGGKGVFTTRLEVLHGEYDAALLAAGGVTRLIETLTAIKRAGADVIITYHTKEAAQWLK